MTKAQTIRLSFIAMLWLVLCYLLVKATPVFNFQTLFAIVASAIIVFVPIYKKYKRNGQTGNK